MVFAELQEGLRTTESELGQLHTTRSWVCDSVHSISSSRTSLVSWLDQVPGWLAKSKAIANNGVYAGTNLALTVVVSHYNGIDLPAVGEGFAAGQLDEEMDTIESMVAPAASQLATTVSPVMVLWMERVLEDAE